APSLRLFERSVDSARPLAATLDPDRCYEGGEYMKKMIASMLAAAFLMTVPAVADTMSSAKPMATKAPKAMATKAPKAMATKAPAKGGAMKASPAPKATKKPLL